VSPRNQLSLLCAHAGLASLLVVAGCTTAGAGAASATPGERAVRAMFDDLGDGEGVVVGKFGVPRFHALGAVGRQVEVRPLAGGPTRRLTFIEELSDDEGRTAPFLARLPAGRYEVTSWRISFVTGEDAQAHAQVEFEVRPGRAACIGALYPLHLWRPSGVPYVTAVIPRDECLLIESQLGPRLPSDPPPVDLALASHTLCRSCRADVAQGGGDPLAGAHDTGDLPLLLAEQRRLGSSDEMPLRWPTQVGGPGGKALRLKVCVSTQGRVVEARVLDSVHAALDGQVVTAVLGWRFQPYVVEGRRVPFCYQPRWQLERPAAVGAATPPVQRTETQRR
jgi:TonB family protein